MLRQYFGFVQCNDRCPTHLEEAFAFVRNSWLIFRSGEFAAARLGALDAALRAEIAVAPVYENPALHQRLLCVYEQFARAEEAAQNQSGDAATGIRFIFNHTGDEIHIARRDGVFFALALRGESLRQPVGRELDFYYAASQRVWCSVFYETLHESAEACKAAVSESVQRTLAGALDRHDPWNDAALHTLLLLSFMVGPRTFCAIYEGACRLHARGQWFTP